MNNAIRTDIQTVVQISDALYYMMENYERLSSTLTDTEKDFIKKLDSVVKAYRKK